MLVHILLLLTCLSADDILHEEGTSMDEDLVLGMDHADRAPKVRNGEMFLK
jgi:hypothetical protein